MVEKLDAAAEASMWRVQMTEMQQRELKVPVNLPDAVENTSALGEPRGMACADCGAGCDKNHKPNCPLINGKNGVGENRRYEPVPPPPIHK